MMSTSRLRPRSSSGRSLRTSISGMATDVSIRDMTGVLLLERVPARFDAGPRSQLIRQRTLTQKP